MNESEYTFEQWQMKSGRGLPYSTIGISKVGNLTISDDLFEKHFSLEYSCTEVFVDPTKKAIGLRPSTDRTKGLPFHKIGGSSKAKVLFTRKLVVFYDIEPRQYLAVWNEKEKMVIFNYRTTSEAKLNETKLL